MSLIEETLFGPVNKIEMALQRIKVFEPKDGYYLAFSGGKDSITVHCLTQMAGVRFDAHYNVTTIDPPELIWFIKRYYPAVHWERPEKPFFTRMLERGFPMRVHRWCCSEYKERGGHGRTVLTGIRKQESVKRAGRKLVEQCFKDSSRTFVNPIIDWSEDEVWEFIRLKKIPYCSLYDEGFRRIGCVMCPYNRHRKKEAYRWPKMRTLFLKTFIQLYEKNKGRPSYRRWKSGQEMFDWWLSDQSYEESDQMVMFE